MYHSGKLLTTDADFDNAMMFGLPVIVWQQGSVLDYGGPIEKHDELSVTIRGTKYLKAVCEFKIR